MGTGVIQAPPLRLRNAVRRLRHARGWSTGELAVRAGVSERAVRHIEATDGHIPEGSTMLKIAGAFGLRMGDVFWSADAGEAA